MDYLKAFITGGLLCVIGQILIDKTKLTPARILVSYVVIGVLLSAIGIYEKFAEFAQAGASSAEKALTSAMTASIAERSARKVSVSKPS